MPEQTRVLLVFTAESSCHYCQMLKRHDVVRKLEQLRPDLTISVHDLSDGETALSRKYNVRGVPLFILLAPSGKVSRRVEGFYTARQLAEGLPG